MKAIQGCFYMRVLENSVGGCKWDVMPATYPHRNHKEPAQSVQNRMFDEERTSELMIYTQTQSPRGGGEAGGTPVQRQSFVADLHRFGVRKQPGIPGLPGNTESSILEMGIRSQGFRATQYPSARNGFPSFLWKEGKEPVREGSPLLSNSNRRRPWTVFFSYERRGRRCLFALSYIHPVLVRVGRSLFAERRPRTARARFSVRLI